MNFKIKNKFIYMIFAVLTLFVLLNYFSEIGLAHKLLIENVDNGEVIVSFDDGTRAAQTEINFLLDEEIILEGRTDREGIFEIDQNLQWDKIVVQDNFGHQAVYIREEQNNFTLPRWAGALIGITILLSIGGFSYYLQKKNK